MAYDSFVSHFALKRAKCCNFATLTLLLTKKML